MEIREIQILKQNTDNIECEVCIGNVAKEVLAEARSKTGYSRPRLYMCGIYDISHKSLVFQKIGEGIYLYTRGDRGQVVPLKHTIQPQSIEQITEITISNLDKRIKQG